MHKICWEIFLSLSIKKEKFLFHFFALFIAAKTEEKSALKQMKPTKNLHLLYSMFLKYKNKLSIIKT